MEVNDSKGQKKLCEGCLGQGYLNNVSFNICLTSFCSPFFIYILTFYSYSPKFCFFFLYFCISEQPVGETKANIMSTLSVRVTLI